jgi:hypothetical protein
VVYDNCCIRVPLLSARTRVELWPKTPITVQHWVMLLSAQIRNGDSDGRVRKWTAPACCRHERKIFADRQR